MFGWDAFGTELTGREEVGFHEIVEKRLWRDSLLA
jgi:hypothetical protein